MNKSEIIHNVARAWASIDGRADRFDLGKIYNDDPTISEKSILKSPDGGSYEGYMCEAEELLRRAGYDFITGFEPIDHPTRPTITADTETPIAADAILQSLDEIKDVLIQMKSLLADINERIGVV